MSAAIMTPSLYFKARTLVPVTIGCLERQSVSGTSNTASICSLGMLDGRGKGILGIIIRSMGEREGAVGIVGIVALGMS